MYVSNQLVGKLTCHFPLNYRLFTSNPRRKAENVKLHYCKKGEKNYKHVSIFTYYALIISFKNSIYNMTNPLNNT